MDSLSWQLFIGFLHLPGIPVNLDLRTCENNLLDNTWGEAEICDVLVEKCSNRCFVSKENLCLYTGDSSRDPTWFPQLEVTYIINLSKGSRFHHPSWRSQRMARYKSSILRGWVGQTWDSKKGDPYQPLKDLKSLNLRLKWDTFWGLYRDILNS